MLPWEDDLVGQSAGGTAIGVPLGPVTSASTLMRPVDGGMAGVPVVADAGFCVNPSVGSRMDGEVGDPLDISSPAGEAMVGVYFIGFDTGDVGEDSVGTSG